MTEPRTIPMTSDDQSRIRDQGVEINSTQARLGALTEAFEQNKLQTLNYLGQLRAEREAYINTLSRHYLKDEANTTWTFQPDTMVYVEDPPK